MTMTTAPAVLDGQDGVVVDHDPAARPRRRTFTAAFKAEILDRYDALPAWARATLAAHAARGSTAPILRSGASSAPRASRSVWPRAAQRVIA